MFEKEKKDCLNACLKMKEYKLISLTGGNVSMRLSNDLFLVTPSGMLYEEMEIEDFVVVDNLGRVVEGKRKPSSDTSALLYIFDKMPQFHAIIHTHQPYATAIGMNNSCLPACMVTLIDANHATIQVAPWTPSSNITMGELAVAYAKEATAVIMKQHGVICFGDSLQEALYSAVYLEEAAKTYVMARIMGNVPELSDEEIASESFCWKQYGQ